MPITAIAIFAGCLVTAVIQRSQERSEMAFLNQDYHELTAADGGEYLAVSEPSVVPVGHEKFSAPDSIAWQPTASDSPTATVDSRLDESFESISASVEVPGFAAIPEFEATPEFVAMPELNEPDSIENFAVSRLPSLPAAHASGSGFASGSDSTWTGSDYRSIEVNDAVESLPSNEHSVASYETQNLTEEYSHKVQTAEFETQEFESAPSDFQAANSQPFAAQAISTSDELMEPANAFEQMAFEPVVQSKQKKKLPTPGGKSKLPTPGGKSKTAKKKTPAVLSGLDEFKLAAQPEQGAHFKDDRPLTDPSAHLVPTSKGNFSPGPSYDGLAYEPFGYMNVYQGKTLNANQRPLVEIGRPWYQLGQLSPGSSVLGFHNNVNPQFIVFGDSRVAYASNTQNGDSVSQIATALNLDLDLKITATERLHAFISPNSGGGKNTRWLMDDDELVVEADANIDFAYFEGDMGSIVGGFTQQTLPFDLPFAVGVMPLFFQNGVWMNDAVLGVAVTIPAKSSAKLDISNMDITFFAGYDKVVSDAFPGDDSAARIIGMASFIEALNGYFEIDYAFLDDRTFDDRSYHNIGIGYTRRWGRFLSNSTRVIVNAGQSDAVVENTADGVLLLSENSLITGAPSTVVPYLNFFAGFDRPQSAARAGAAGGVLVNTGILFESDNLTNYPTLDSSANDTFGMALGTNLLASDFSQQLVVEAAMLGVMGDDANRKAKGDQYGVGVRYQLPLTNSVIFRTDAMMGFLRNDDDVHGVRMELRKKF